MGVCKLKKNTVKTRVILFFVVFILLGVIIIQATKHIQPHNKDIEKNIIKQTKQNNNKDVEKTSIPLKIVNQKKTSTSKVLDYFNLIGEKYPWIEQKVKDAGITRYQVKQIASIIEKNKYLMHLYLYQN